MSKYTNKTPHPLAAMLVSAVHSSWGDDDVEINASEVCEDGLSVYVEGYLSENGKRFPVDGVIRIESFNVGFPEWDDDNKENDR